VAADPVDQLDLTASRQHGVVTSRQADAILGAARKGHWIRTGRLQWIQPGVLRLLGSPSSWHQQLAAAQLGADGVVSHRAAAHLWGLLRGEGAVEVSVGPRRQPRLRAPALVHRIKDLHPELAVRRTGLRLTDPRRTLVDLGLVVPARVVGDALSRGLTTKLVTLDDVRWLREALGRQGRNGTGIIGELLDRRAPTAGREESLLEHRFVDLVTRAGLEIPTLQHEIWHDGRFVARVDAAYLDVRLAIELDGYETRESPEALRRELSRQNRVLGAGWALLRFTWADVVADGTKTISQIVIERSRLAHRRDLCSTATT
jgi:hypothetical protein